VWMWIRIRKTKDKRQKEKGKRRKEEGEMGRGGDEKGESKRAKISSVFNESPPGRGGGGFKK